MFLGPWACGSECCSSNSNAPDTSQKALIGIQSHHSREKMSKKAREKPAEAGSASVSPYGAVLSYELVTSQPNRLINLIWPECRTWYIGPWRLRACDARAPCGNSIWHQQVDGRLFWRPKKKLVFAFLVGKKAIYMLPYQALRQFTRIQENLTRARLGGAVIRPLRFFADCEKRRRVAPPNLP